MPPLNPNSIPIGNLEYMESETMGTHCFTFHLLQIAIWDSMGTFNGASIGFSSWGRTVAPFTIARWSHCVGKPTRRCIRGTVFYWANQLLIINSDLSVCDRFSDPIRILYQVSLTVPRSWAIRFSISYPVAPHSVIKSSRELLRGIPLLFSMYTTFHDSDHQAIIMPHYVTNPFLLSLSDRLK